MKARRVILMAAAAVLLGTVGLAGSLLLADPRKPTVPAPAVGAVPISVDELSRASGVRLFFGHMSVGQNIISGINALYPAKGLTAPTVVEFAVDGPLPQAPSGGGVLHTAIGQNGDPLGKLRNFDAVLRSGLADRVDVALLKFCYVDITTSTDLDTLFAEYRRTLDALQRDYPRVRFLHSTAPLTVGPTGLKDRLKVLLGRDQNVARERYNELVRKAYPADQLLDIAAIEGTAPDGSRRPELYAGYTTDGEHLNEGASALAAADLLRLVAAVGRA